jgi:hypothetical protein
MTSRPSKVIKWDTAPKPGVDLEARVVVWDSKKVIMMDVEDTSDGYVKCFFDTDKKCTDTHWRNTDGKMSWNWRMLFGINQDA